MLRSLGFPQSPPKNSRSADALCVVQKKTASKFATKSCKIDSSILSTLYTVRAQ